MLVVAKWKSDEQVIIQDRVVFSKSNTYIGYTPQEDNDEVDAYLITYIYDKITSIFYKHDRAAK